MPFCAGIVLGHCTVPSTVFSQPYGKKTIIWCPFYSFKSKRLFRMNLIHGNSDNISHVHILTYLGMTSSLTSEINDITQHFSLNLFLVLSFDTKMESFRGKPIFWKFALYSNQCVLQEHSITANISMDISSSQFYQKYYYIWCIKRCKC